MKYKFIKELKTKIKSLTKISKTWNVFRKVSGSFRNQTKLPS